MAVVTFDVDAGYDFSMVNLDISRHNTLSGSSTKYQWNSDQSTRMIMSGTGFTTDDDSVPSGTATGFSINQGGGNVELSVTGLSISLSDVYYYTDSSNFTAEQQSYFIWQLVLSGNDSITFKATAGIDSSFFAGDGWGLQQYGVYQGGNDKMTGEISWGAICGDLVDTDGTLYGGDDVITVSCPDIATVYGDTRLDRSIVVGGDDQISAGQGITEVGGDIFFSASGASLWGGDDTISLAVAGVASGDALGVRGLAICGGDLITGSTGDDQLCGDIVSVYAMACVRAGNDEIHGNKGNDSISGDWQTIEQPVRIKTGGGNDKLYGDAGADTIFGNLGSDVIDGGTGNDLIDGGQGNDKLVGSAGADIFVFSSGYGKDVVIDLAAVDKVDIRAWADIDTFAHLKSHAVDHGKDVWITDDADTLVIAGHHKANLQAVNFIF